MKCFFTLAALTLAAPASAELIFFSGERSMSVASHSFEDDRVIVTSRGRGMHRSIANHEVAPDEVADRKGCRPRNDSSRAVLVGKRSTIRSRTPSGDTAWTHARKAVSVESAFQEARDSPRRDGIDAADAATHGSTRAHAIRSRAISTGHEVSEQS